MKTLVVKGHNVLVDDGDYEWLDDLFGWGINQQGYIVLKKRLNKKPTTRLMSRLIMLAGPDQEVDHIDGDPLNNQRSNLRLCTVQQNRFNRRKKRSATASIFKGISIAPEAPNSYVVRVGYAGKNYYAGSFTDEHTAALMYDFWAIQLHGEFANTNFKVVSSTNSPVSA
jgi:hypothetical protein